MASGSASYAVSATNYGRNSADSYFVLSAPDVINGSLEVTGNLRVDGTSRLVGAVTCDGAVTAAGAVTAGSVSTAGNVTCAAVTASGAVNSATLAVSAASVLAGVTAQAIGCTSVTASGAVTAAGITTSGLTAGASTLGVITSPGISAGSFGQSAGGSIVAPTAQYTMVFGAWRFTWGLSQSANGGGDTGAIVFGTPFAGVPCVFASPSSAGANGFFSATNVTATQIGNLHGQTTGGTGFGVSAFWLAIGQA